MNDFLTKDKRHLTLFQDNIVIDKRLLKWRRAEQGIEKTKTPDGSRVSVVSLNNNSADSNSVRPYLINTTSDRLISAEEYRASMGMEPPAPTDNFDPDRDLNAQPSWLPLYETPEGVKFDELATAGIRDLTKLIVEKKIKYVMAGYGSFGSTVGSLTYGGPIEDNNSDSARLRLTLEERKKKMSEGGW